MDNKEFTNSPLRRWFPSIYPLFAKFFSKQLSLVLLQFFLSAALAGIFAIAVAYSAIHILCGPTKPSDIYCGAVVGVFASAPGAIIGMLAGFIIFSHIFGFVPRKKDRTFIVTEIMAFIGAFLIGIALVWFSYVAMEFIDRINITPRFIEDNFLVPIFLGINLTILPFVYKTLTKLLPQRW